VRCILRTLTLGALSSAIGCSGAAESTEQQSVSAVSTTSAQPESKALAAHAGYALTPMGVFAHEDCIHHLDEGDAVVSGGVRRKSGRIDRYPACTHPEIPAKSGSQAHGGAVPPGQRAAQDSGWVEQIYWDAPGPVGQFSVQFHVPAAPAHYDGQTIFIFPSLTGGGAILQTVIQYGASQAGGGPYWALAEWCGGGGEYGGNYYASNLIPVNTGDTIQSDIAGNCGWGQNGNGCLWEMTGQDLNTGGSVYEGTYINISWTRVEGIVLEVYGVDTCADYPSTYDNAWGWNITPWGGGASWNPTWSGDIFYNDCDNGSGNCSCGQNVSQTGDYINIYY
jgi:hypothetical protein